MDVSIIIPAVKDRGWLDDAIRSCINQDFKGTYEIILASDGNPGLKKFADKYHLKFSLIPRGNLSKNQNAAMKIAEGKYIKGCADDDLLTSNCLRVLHNNIKDYDLIYAGAKNFNKVETLSIPKPASFNRIYKKNGIHGGTVMFRSDVFWDVGGRDESIDCCEDYDFYLNLLSHGYKFTYVDRIVYKYRKHPGQKSWYAGSPHREKTKEYIRSKYKWYYDKINS